MRSLALCCVLLSLLSACFRRPPDMPYTEVPAEPLARSLAQQADRFATLKALARVETERRGKRRVLESVAILQRGRERLLVEGYGPLGERLFGLLWDGSTVSLLPPDGSPVRTLGPAGIERIAGVRLLPEDLCAVLAGSAPPVPGDAAVRAGCSTDGRCAIDIPGGDGRWRVHAVLPAAGTGEDLRIDALERYRGRDLLFLVRYEGRVMHNGYSLPGRVTVREPGRDTALTVEYLDAEVNVPLDNGVFVLPEVRENVP